MTDEVFSALEHLNDCEFLAKPEFDLFETMSAFEAMDPKMDMRMKRREAPKVGKDSREWTKEEETAVMEEFFVQIATWQSSNA